MASNVHSHQHLMGPVLVSGGLTPKMINHHVFRHNTVHLTLDSPYVQ